MASTMTISSARETLMLARDFQRTVFFQQPKYGMYYNILMIIYVPKYIKKTKRKKDKKKTKKIKNKIKKKVISKKLSLRSYFLKKTKSVYYLVMFFLRKLVLYI